MNRSVKFFLSLLVILSGFGFSDVVGKAIVRSISLDAWIWPVEDKKDGQITIQGRSPAGGFGDSLARGDVNGDGYDDLIVGARFVSDATLAGGEVYVLLGPLSFGKSFTVDQKAALTFRGESGWQPQIGTYTDSGDMNGDGYDEIIFGSMTQKQVYVYAGSPEIKKDAPRSIPVSPDQFMLTVTGSGGGLAICDLNGDGYQDLFLEELSPDLVAMVWGIFGRADLAAQNRTIHLP